MKSEKTKKGASPYRIGHRLSKKKTSSKRR